MLNTNQIMNSRKFDEPFTHVLIDSLIERDDTQSLLASIPIVGNKISVRNVGTDKTYQVVNNILKDLNRDQPEEYVKSNPIWNSLINQIIGDDYKNSLSKQLEFDLKDLFMEITLKRYRFQDFISPHTDRDTVPLTHLIFLNTYWEKKWGGMFCILNDKGSVEKEILPTFNNSVAFLQSDKSWHSVSRIHDPNHDRIAIQVAFWNTNKRDVQEGRNETEIIMA